jgi:hypothetical protein
VDSSVTCIIEFVCPAALIDDFYAIQHKPEHGTLSHGMGK